MSQASKNQSKLLRSSAKMAVATMISRVLGLFRVQLIASYFGASGLTDAFFIAYRIPNLMRDLFAEGAFSAAFVPKFIEELKKNKESARDLLWSLFLCLILVTGSISLGIYLFAEDLIRVFASEKFLLDGEKLNAAVTMTKMMAPYLTLVSLAALLMGALNSLKIFFIPALAPALLNIVVILAIILGTPYFEASSRGIYSIALGILIAGFFQNFMQLPSLFKNGFGFKIPKKIFHSQNKSVFKKLGPGLIGFAATQMNLIVGTILATGTIAGAVSWLDYAFRLFQFPVGILGVSLGNSNLVHFTSLWKEDKKQEAKDVLKSGYELSLFVMLLAFALIYALADESVNLVFEYGKFGESSRMMTTMALKAYLLGLPFYGIYKIFVPTFYTLDKEKVPVVCSIVSILINIIFCICLTPYWGFKTLALGASLSIFMNSFFQAVMIKRFLGLPSSFFINKRIIKFVTSSIVTLFVIDFSANQLSLLEMSMLVKIISFGALCLSGIVLYSAITIVTGEREHVRLFLNLIRRRR